MNVYIKLGVIKYMHLDFLTLLGTRINGTDHPAHPRSLISAFAIHSQQIIISYIVSEYDQEIPKSQSADKPMAREEEPQNNHETPGKIPNYNRLFDPNCELIFFKYQWPLTPKLSCLSQHTGEIIMSVKTHCRVNLP